MNVHSLSNLLTKPVLTSGFSLAVTGHWEEYPPRLPNPAPPIGWRPGVQIACCSAPLRGIRNFVRLCAERRRHALWLLNKLQDRQDCAQTQKRINRRFHDASAFLL